MIIWLSFSHDHGHLEVSPLSDSPIWANISVLDNQVNIYVLIFFLCIWIWAEAIDGNYVSYVSLQCIYRIYGVWPFDSLWHAVTKRSSIGQSRETHSHRMLRIAVLDWSGWHNGGHDDRTWGRNDRPNRRLKHGRRKQVWAARATWGLEKDWMWALKPWLLKVSVHIYVHEGFVRILFALDLHLSWDDVSVMKLQLQDFPSSLDIVRSVSRCTILKPLAQFSTLEACWQEVSIMPIFLWLSWALGPLGCNLDM